MKKKRKTKEGRRKSNARNKNRKVSKKGRKKNHSKKRNRKLIWVIFNYDTKSSDGEKTGKVQRISIECNIDGSKTLY